MTRDEIVSKLSIVPPDSEAAIELSSMLIFHELGWDIIYAEHEVEGDPTMLGRNSHDQVLLDQVLLSTLKDINPSLPKVALDLARDELSRDRSTMDIDKANQLIITGLAMIEGCCPVCLLVPAVHCLCHYGDGAKIWGLLKLLWMISFARYNKKSKNLTSNKTFPRRVP